jgi:hypothetical protein
MLYRRYYPQVQAQIFVAEADQGVLSLHHGEDVLDLRVSRDGSVHRADRGTGSGVLAVHAHG